MKKNHLIILAVVAVAGWFGWKWWQKRQAATVVAKPVTPAANANAAA